MAAWEVWAPVVRAVSWEGEWMLGWERERGGWERGRWERNEVLEEKEENSYETYRDVDS